MLVFTMEDVWLERHPGEDSSVHLRDFPETPDAWRDEALAAKWDAIRKVRRVVTGAIEVQRRDKVIGASLEAAPSVYVADAAVLVSLQSVPFDDVCITSGISLSGDGATTGAFTMPDTDGVAVVFATADGEKCLRCWKILPDVGTHGHEGVCGRCEDALG